MYAMTTHPILCLHCYLFVYLLCIKYITSLSRMFNNMPAKNRPRTRQYPQFQKGSNRKL